MNWREATGGGAADGGPESGTWQTVSTSQELPDGGVRAFETPVVFGFVGRANGQLFAVSGACTHLGCKLALNRAARELRCPCHTATFSLTGAVAHHPRPACCAIRAVLLRRRPGGQCDEPASVMSRPV